MKHVDPEEWTRHELSIERALRRQHDEQIAVLKAHNVWYGPEHLRPVDVEPEPAPEPEPMLAPPGRISASVIIAACADAGNVSVSELTGDKRGRRVSSYRFVAAYLIRKHRKLSLPDTGRRVGRDHSTIKGVLRKVEQDLANGGERFGRIIENVEKRLGI